jgi:hypothetical protein
MLRYGLAALAAVLLTASDPAPQHPAAAAGGYAGALTSEVFSYNVEWRFIHAGDARLAWSPSGDGWSARLHLESAGLVSRLYKVSDDYSSHLDRNLCATSSSLKADEGSRRHETDVTFDAARRKASHRDRDLVNNITVAHEIDIGPCEHDVIGALQYVRQLKLEPGKTVELPVSDGKKAIMARVEAQERETIKTDYGKYKTIRYEAFLFNNVLYRRRGRLFVWLTDDDRRLPVQIRVRMPFYVGTITLQLVKEGKP